MAKRGGASKVKVGDVHADLRTRHGLATASMVLGIIAFFIGWIPLFGWAIVTCAIIFGFLAFSEIKHNPDRLKGKSQAIAGIVLGFYVIFTGLIMLIISGFLIVSTAPLLGVLDGYAFNFNCIDGSGHLLTQDRELEGFSKIEASEQVTVYVTRADNFSVLVSAENNLIENVRARVEGDTLIVDTSRLCFDTKKPITVSVTMPSVDYLGADSGASIVIEETFPVDTLYLDISSAGDIIAYVRATKVVVDASSAAQATITGTAQEFEVEASSASIVDAYGLIVPKVTAEASSASVINTFVISELSVDASSASVVNYRGDGQVIHEDISSGATLRKK